VTVVVCDANVVVNWFVPDEPGSAEAVSLVRGPGARALAVHVLDLTLYEVGNVLIRKRGVSGDRISTVLRSIRAITGPVIRLTAPELELLAAGAGSHPGRALRAARDRRGQCLARRP
jgi:hypothetical protein